MSNQPEYQQIIARLSRQLKLLSPDQKSTRLSSATPNILEMVDLITKNPEALPETFKQVSPNNDILFHLGQLVMLAEILVAQNKRPTLVRWFE